MSRPLLSLLLAAAVATAAAFGGGVEQLSAGADSSSADTSTTPTAATAPAALAPAAPTSGLAPRVVVPERGLDIEAAPTPEPEPRPPGRTVRGAGELVAAAGTSRDPVERGGSTVRFSVEVEAATGLDPEEVAAVAEDALYDERSWARDHELQRVAPADAWIHVVVASPDTVDALCRRAGLDTAGWLSCWTGNTAAINVDRWTQGVPHFDDLDQYRRYVVSHEVGHGLGHGHRDCPGGGQLAPLMQQQSKSLGGCRPNEWRHTDD